MVDSSTHSDALRHRDQSLALFHGLDRERIIPHPMAPPPDRKSKKQGQSASKADDDPEVPTSMLFRHGGGDDLADGVIARVRYKNVADSVNSDARGRVELGCIVGAVGIAPPPRQTHDRLDHIVRSHMFDQADGVGPVSSI